MVIELALFAREGGGVASVTKKKRGREYHWTPPGRRVCRVFIMIFKAAWHRCQASYGPISVRQSQSACAKGRPLPGLEPPVTVVMVCSWMQLVSPLGVDTSM
jgi:hypothetical protein